MASNFLNTSTLVLIAINNIE